MLVLFGGLQIVELVWCWLWRWSCVCHVDIFLLVVVVVVPCWHCGGGGGGVWESREQPAAALNHWCTEHWALRTTCSAVRTLSAIIAALNAMHWVVRRGESWGNPKMSLVLCQLVCNPSHRQEGGSPTFDQKKFYQKITDWSTSLQTLLPELLRNKAKNGVFVTRHRAS